jgi:hypothetical protein
MINNKKNFALFTLQFEGQDEVFLFDTGASTIRNNKGYGISFSTVQIKNTIAKSFDGINWTGLGSTLFSREGNKASWNGNISNGNVKINHPIIAIGSGTNNMAYSRDGINWVGLGTTLLSTATKIIWDGARYIACDSVNPIYSQDGFSWTAMTGVGSTNKACFNGNIWIMMGGSANTNKILYSYNGIFWIGIGSAIFSTQGYSCIWTGNKFVAVGVGTNSIATSNDGITWVGSGATIFTTGFDLCCFGSLIIAVGQTTNTIAYSINNASTWTGVGVTFFSTAGYGVCCNETTVVAVGAGTNTIVYSTNGTSWTGIGITIFSTAGNSVCWTGNEFIAVGSGTNSIAYSYNGITW